jgi:hypothetical protein
MGRPGFDSLPIRIIAFIILIVFIVIITNNLHKDVYDIASTAISESCSDECNNLAKDWEGIYPFKIEEINECIQGCIKSCGSKYPPNNCQHSYVMGIQVKVPVEDLDINKLIQDCNDASIVRSNCLAALSAKLGGNPDVCEQISEPGTKQKCYRDAAIQKINESLCDYIPDERYRAVHCLAVIAQKKTDSSICDGIKVSGFESENQKEICLKAANQEISYQSNGQWI